MPRDELRKGSAEFLVLALLEHEARHGYELSKLITARSRGTLTFNVASLYPLLYRLERRGWVKRTPAPDDGRGVLLRLTDEGREAIVGFAQVHVASVRRHLVDILTPEQFAAMGEAMQAIRDAYAADPATPEEAC